ncbi:MAG: dCMP deaminase family protein [Bacilli bacterium]|nr:dCMP deaminase family protein [Mollicutes bacterium]MDY3900033.1 dCMP deaminase family protein [Bacilli bacterium]
MGKSKEYITWDQYFMGVAKLSALRSKDPNTKVGACIVNEKKRIVGIGYNGLPYGCSDDEFPWERDGDFLETKYPYVVHAEPNAILNSTNKLDNATLYVTLFPCNECAKLIIQSGIKEIVYVSDKYNGSNDNVASKRMLAAAGVKCRQMENVEVIIKTDDSIY